MGIAEVESTQAVLEVFDSAFVVKKQQLPPLELHEILVKITASGICGSDLHMWHGKDPRTRLPIVLGHEGVGIIEEFPDKQKDVFGTPLKKGDTVIWDRGVVCGRCVFCTVKKRANLCPEREVYGITRDGCHATHLVLKAGTAVIKIEQEIKPEVMVSAGCSGATAAHAVELAGIKPGDTVLIYGPGPLGIFASALCSQRGATCIMMVGTKRSRQRLELAAEFGATDTMTFDETTFGERMARIKKKTDGAGADVVIDCAGSRQTIEEGLKILTGGGSFVLPGLATPQEKIGIDFYRDIVRANIRIQGVWVNDTCHLNLAKDAVLSGKYPFDKLITHVFPLKEINRAMQAVADRKAFKAVLKP